LVLEIQSPDAVFWALSALWSVWLWRDQVRAPIGGFLSRRRLTWDWYTRGLSVGLIQAKQLLRPQAYALCILDNAYAAATEALVEAIKRSEFQLCTWVGDSDTGYYVLLRSEESITYHAVPPRHACEAVVAKRGEPTSEEYLEVAARLVSNGKPLKPQDLEEDVRWTKMGQDRWWFHNRKESEKPLADRIEQTVIEMLTAKPTWQRSKLIQEIYSRFKEESSPELTLVETCLDAYAEAREGSPPDQITRRDEDNPEQRGKEIRELKKALEKLGQRLSYRTNLTESGDVLWIEEGETHYRFRCITTAILTPHISPRPKADGRQCYLVLPGGRAALITLKLKRDPRLPQWLKHHRWQFIKFRHLRRMIREVRNRSDIEVYLGLDPIVEQAQAQIPLPLRAERMDVN
jgi:hypothetical protein